MCVAFGSPPNRIHDKILCPTDRSYTLIVVFHEVLSAVILNLCKLILNVMELNGSSVHKNFQRRQCCSPVAFIAWTGPLINSELLDQSGLDAITNNHEKI